MKTSKLEKVTSYHEAGHAIMYLILGEKFHSVTIEPSRYTNGEVKQNIGETIKTDNFAVILYSGIVAESKYRKCDLLKCVTEGGHVDYKGVQKMARRWKKFHRNCNINELDIAFRDVSRFYINYYWVVVKKIACELQKKKTLTYNDVCNIVETFDYCIIRDGEI